VLAKLPLTRKRDLIELQKGNPPFGGLNALPVGQAWRVFASPGPIYELQGPEVDPWQMARVLYAAGFRSGELVHNCFSYHFTPGAYIFEEGARKLGCPVFPGGVGNTEQQIQAMVDLRPAGYVGTPSFLKIIIDKADELKADISSLRKAAVSGEAVHPSVRKTLRERGISIRQSYATADIGAIAYESEAEDGLIVEEEVLLEIVRPGTGDPVAVGEVGEIVVTTFNPTYPLIRFATGDLSAVLTGVSPCGRTNQRIKGWLGRADQTTKVKGMFVHPEQIADIARRHPELQRLRLVVDNPDGQDQMVLHCETTASGEALTQAVIVSIRELTKLRGEVVLCPPGSLANDGKVIEDRRTYS
ncbi:MAG: AMP-binding protein, partial [Candidatus Competibacter sp.]